MLPYTIFRIDFEEQHFNQAGGISVYSNFKFNMYATSSLSDLRVSLLVCKQPMNFIVVLGLSFSNDFRPMYSEFII
jgi:hypothetical protein